MSKNTLAMKQAPSFGFIVFTTSLAFVVSQLDVSIVNIALPQIASAFSASISQLQWVVDAYTVAFAALMLSAGGMGDLLGAKRLFQLGILVFCAASVGCGLSWSSWSLIGFRALQGLGAAAMLPSSLSILNHAFSSNTGKRAHAVALWVAAGAVAIAAGPILGGLLIHFSNWRAIFFVNVPICIIGLLCSIPLTTNERQHTRGFDIPGQAAWSLMLVALITAIIEWPDLGPRHPVIFGGIAVTILSGFIFFRLEKRAESPILPLDMLSSRMFNSMVLLASLLNATYYGTIFVLSLYLQKVMQYSPLRAGVAFLPLTAGFIISNLLSGRLTRLYSIRVPIVYGVIIYAVAFFSLIIARSDTPYWQMILPFLLIPLGMGLAIPAMTVGILSSVDKARSGTASAVFNTSRQAAGAIGVAVLGAMAKGDAPRIVHSIMMISLSTGAILLLAGLILFRYIQPKPSEAA
jgi:MFS transporter, DHA2 family, methylenomycin A resistance protein